MTVSTSTPEVEAKMSDSGLCVAVGDIYRDTDPRISDRRVKVTSFDSRFAYVVGCSEWGRETGRRTRIGLAGLQSRFERVGRSTLREDLERAALTALIEWRKADRELFVAKAVYAETSVSAEPKLWLEVVRLKKVEEEKRALAMVAADAFAPPEGFDPTAERKASE